MARIIFASAKTILPRAKMNYACALQEDVSALHKGVLRGKKHKTATLLRPFRYVLGGIVNDGYICANK